MATISQTDLIMATAYAGGRAVAEFSNEGFASMADVLRYTRRVMGISAGMVSVKVRNFTQGWAREMALYVA